MENTFKETGRRLVKWSVLILTWLTLPPVFLYLSYRWKIFRKWLRWVLTFISPLFLSVFLMLAILIFLFGRESGLNPYRDDNYFSKEKRLEKITGVQFDVKEVIDYQRGTRSFTGDYSDETVILLKSLPDYRKLDSLAQKNIWRKTKDGYHFQAMWGNGLSAPEGEDEKEDRFLSVRVVYGCDTLYIESGMW